MRQRRKKKRQAQGTNESQKDVVPGHGTVSNGRPDESSETLSDSLETGSKPLAKTSESDARPSRKRQRDEHTEGAAPPGDKRKRLSLQSKVIDGKLHMVIPSSLAATDLKKFRKDARRQLRQEGKDYSNVVFVDEDELPPAMRKSKKKRDFPSINELLQQKKQFQQAHKEEQKFKEKLQQLPDDVKAQYVALDCEMVGIGTDGKKSALARVSIVDWNLDIVLDSFVRVPIRVTDFRTHVSGVEPKHIKDKKALDVEECRNRVAEIIKDKILVGHALSNDFKALMLNHPKAKIRDTAKYRPFQRYGNGKWRPRRLRDLVKENLKGREGFQEAEHDSVQDARATMELFQVVRSQWEKELANKK